MSNIVSLSGNEVPAPGEADPKIIKLLELWLERARNGAITSVALASTYQNQDAGSGWAGTLDNALIGSVHIMVHDLTGAVIEGGRRED